MFYFQKLLLLINLLWKPGVMARLTHWISPWIKKSFLAM